MFEKQQIQFSLNWWNSCEPYASLIICKAKSCPTLVFCFVEEFGVSYFQYIF